MADSARAAGAATNPKGTAQLHEYWVHGEGAAKIKWGSPGDFDRCVMHLGKFIADPKGYCAKAHHDALGYWPATHAKMEGKAMAGEDGEDRAGAKQPYGDVPYADPGYLDADGNQASKSGKPGVKRYPLSADKVMAAWTYISQKANAGQYTPEQLKSIKGKIKAAMAKHGHMVSDTDTDGNSADPGGEERRPDGGDMLIRSVPFEVTRAADSRADGLTLEGYAAVFNRKATIADRQGDFEEQIAPGAFTESLARRKPVLMFEHGKHPLIGSMPLGRITDAHEDQRGLFISARLSDNWLIQPVRDAVRDGAVDGMSFRFTPPGDDDQQWAQRAGKPDLRTLLRLNCPELGPVVFPAYEPTTATVRSLLDGLDLDEDFTGRDGARSAPGGDRKDVQPGNGGPSPTTSTAVLRDRAWRMRRQPYA
jgi:HK97 family phage prohead protease